MAVFCIVLFNTVNATQSVLQSGTTTARGPQPDHSSAAFTLLELIVVIATVAVLCALLLPAMAYTTDLDKRAACRNHLRQIGVAMTLYAGENRGRLVRARYTSWQYVQLAMNPLPTAVAASVGLPTNVIAKSDSTSIWTCPNRPGFPELQPQYPQWVLGYQYFGGVASWYNPYGTFPSRSPTNLYQAQPHWTLAADVTMKINGAWGAQEPGVDTYTNVPPHHSADAFAPQGGNQVFMDGSARWVPFERMYYLTTWDISGDRIAYFFQDPKDFPSALKSALPLLRARP